jgi:hypothetical protein
MSGQRYILNSITAIARQLGRAPSLAEFVSRTGIPKYSVFQLFPRWNEAVRAVGLQPCRVYARPEDSELLKDWGETVRKKRSLPSRRAYLLEGKHESRTLEKRFGDWSAVPQAFRNFAKGKREWADVVALLTAAESRRRPGRPKEAAVSLIPRNQVQHALLKDRATYGNPIDFRGLRHEPVNE